MGLPGPSAMIGFVSGFTGELGGTAPSIRTSGGTETTAAAIEQTITSGEAEITFTGTFTGVTDATKLVLLPTTVNLGRIDASFGVTVNETTITVDITTVDSGGVGTAQDFSLVLLQGN